MRSGSAVLLSQSRTCNPSAFSLSTAFKDVCALCVALLAWPSDVVQRRCTQCPSSNAVPWSVLCGTYLVHSSYLHSYFAQYVHAKVQMLNARCCRLCCPYSIAIPSIVLPCDCLYARHVLCAPGISVLTAPDMRMWRQTCSMLVLAVIRSVVWSSFMYWTFLPSGVSLFLALHQVLTVELIRSTLYVQCQMRVLIPSSGPYLKLSMVCVISVMVLSCRCSLAVFDDHLVIPLCPFEDVVLPVHDETRSFLAVWNRIAACLVDLEIGHS